MLNLTVNSNTEDSLIFGLDGTGTYTFGREGNYALSLAGGVGYDIMTDSPLVASTLAGGGAAFGTRGAEPDEFVYRAGVGLTATPTERAAVEFRYEFDGRAVRTRAMAAQSTSAGSSKRDNLTTTEYQSSTSVRGPR